MQAVEPWQYPRRKFLVQGAALSAASFLTFADRAHADPPPETRRLVLNSFPVTCVAPVFVVNALLQAEGFTDIQYQLDTSAVSVGSGRPDLDLMAVCPILIHLDLGAPIVTLASMHLGCYELFATEHVHSIRDLKGKTVPVAGLLKAQHTLLSSMAAYVGLDPRKDINWVVTKPREGPQIFASGQADAYLAFPPEPQELRAARAGHVIVNTATDKPWSQYGCCMLVTHRAFFEQYPVATKRAMRALLKAADLCTSAPERVARILVEKKVTDRYDYALETLREVHYDAWRDYDPEDSMRFYGNRLYEAGMIKSHPNDLIARGYDGRLLAALRKEMKA